MWSGPVSTCNIHDFVLVRVIACLLSFELFRLTTRNGSNHCIGPKKNRRLGLFVFVVSFGARPVSKCKVHDFVLVHVIACLLFFFFVSFGHTQWLQPLHRTKKKTGGSACLSLLFLCLLVCSFVFFVFKIVNVECKKDVTLCDPNQCQTVEEPLPAFSNVPLNATCFKGGLLESYDSP